MPGRHGGAGQRGGFFIGEIPGDSNQPFFVKCAGLAQDAIQFSPAKRRAALLRGPGAFDPALEKGGAHAIAGFPFRDALAHRGDLPGAIGQGHGRQIGARIVKARGKEQVAIVQRGRVEFHHDLARGGLRFVALGEREIFQAQFGISISLHEALPIRDAVIGIRSNFSTPSPPIPRVHAHLASTGARRGWPETAWERRLRPFS
jgi:hypothetical protein